MKITILAFGVYLCLITPCFSQEIDAGLESAFQYRNIGPANQGGRITDIEADRNDFTKAYIAVASGGVWKTANAGTTWQPIFDDYETASIGDIAIDPQDYNTLWVGTGEANNRNSVSWGNGMYVTKDGGETFQSKGLESTHQIARVLVHPKDSDKVCACAIGHLWGYSGERGLFQTDDGGNSWNKLDSGLPSDGKTGCIDLIRDPRDPDVMIAAFYHRLRQPWHFHSGGEEGGIYKTTDGGRSWKKLSEGLPKETGRIGLAIYEKNPDIMMAIVEAEKTDDLAKPGSGIYRSEDGGKTWKYTNTYNNRPFYYSQIRINPLNDQKVYVLTTRFMISNDGGETFQNGSADYEIHGDFHALWSDPTDESRYWIGADKGLSLTHDNGQHFQLMDNLPIAQFYRINFDMQDPYYIYGGLQDNGSYATASFARDARGILNDANWKMHWGDGQDSAIDPTDHTDMYSSMENGSYFKYNPETRKIRRISPNAFNTINHSDYFTDDLEDYKSAARFNWSAPLVMSPHDSDHIYVGGNHLYLSVDNGNTWEIISPDLSSNHSEKRIQGRSGGITPDNTGAETHCSITAISPSLSSPQTLWVGTDDGNIQVTKDRGKTWTEVAKNNKQVPEGSWVSRLEVSKFVEGRAYVSYDGHRSDDFETYVFVTENYGASWQSITSGFTRGETVRVIREDVKNPNLLFAGTETGVWFSMNRGQSWSRLKLNMPTVSIYDIKIHPRDNDLLVGTHGRSLWVLDDISPLQQMAGTANPQKPVLFDQELATLWANISRGGQRGHFLFAGDNPKNIHNTSSKPRAGFDNYVGISYYVPSNRDSLLLHITDVKKEKKATIKVSGAKGYHRVYWNRVFEASDFSKDDMNELDKILQAIVDEIDNSRVKRIYKKFQAMDDSDEIRRLIAPLTGGYLNYDFSEKFLIPKAGTGSYYLKLGSGKDASTSVVVIRDDPMLKP